MHQSWHPAGMRSGGRDFRGRWRMRRLFGAVVQGLALGVAMVGATTPAAYGADAIQVKTPLEVAARMSPRAIRSRLTDVVRTPGGAIVAVGQRGHIVVSRDNGKSWQQSPVPVSSDLVAVQFPSAQVGWAVGHDGVVLKTVDGGQSWSVMLTGRTYGDILVRYYEETVRRGKTDAMAALDQAARLKEDGADKPFLGVWFDDGRRGWVVGAFNLILGTEDGGETWHPWIDRIDNDAGYTLFDIRRVGGELYIAGELGLFLRLDHDKGRFVRVETPYRGSYFGVTGDDRLLVVYGLRGNAFASTDKGRTWSRFDTGLAGGISKAGLLADGRLLFVSGDGEIRFGGGTGGGFDKLPYSNPMSLGSFAELGDGHLLVVGSSGTRDVPLPEM
ncbi:WD40/YVTN/BNR-like repeat-containing protein [Aromatoleum toluclasticum]|uniref:WD40/YVTN/BNR-like repeat-containing protein n=1 Tax=Aromatoleum toluclasticum TaxID=92003 RepID=UPI000A002E1C|nr:YCF48-related protein [Aromatoleum toluclasticum]